MENRKSVFVNVLGWVMVVLFGFGLLTSVMQNIMINVAFPLEEMQESFNNDPVPDGFPSFLFRNIRLTFALLGVIMLTGFIVSVAFLKRKKWARMGLMILFAIGIIYNLGTLIFQWIFVNENFAQSPDELGGIIVIMKVIMTVFTIGISVLFAWLITKLSAENVKLEFEPTPPHSNGS